MTVDGPIDDLDTTDNVGSAAITVGELPRTGANLSGFALIGLLFLAIGLMLWFTTRRRDEDEATETA